MPNSITPFVILVTKNYEDENVDRDVARRLIAFEENSLSSTRSLSSIDRKYFINDTIEMQSVYTYLKLFRG